MDAGLASVICSGIIATGATVDTQARTAINAILVVLENLGATASV